MAQSDRSLRVNCQVWLHRATIVPMKADFHRQQLAREAKAIVALAFPNGPIEEMPGRPALRFYWAEQRRAWSK